jgi:hypothetical protein
MVKFRPWQPHGPGVRGVKAIDVAARQSGIIASPLHRFASAKSLAVAAAMDTVRGVAARGTSSEASASPNAARKKSIVGTESMFSGSSMGAPGAGLPATASAATVETGPTKAELDAAVITATIIKHELPISEKLVKQLAELKVHTAQSLKRIHAVSTYSAGKLHEALSAATAAGSKASNTTGQLTPDERADMSLFSLSYQTVMDHGYTRDDIPVAQRLTERHYKMLRKIFLWYSDTGDDGNVSAGTAAMALEGLQRLVSWIGATVPGKLDHWTIPELLQSAAVIPGPPTAAVGGSGTAAAPAAAYNPTFDARRFMQVLAIVAARRSEAAAGASVVKGPQALEQLIEGPLRAFAEYADLQEVLHVTKEDEVVAQMLSEFRNDVFKVYRAFCGTGAAGSADAAPKLAYEPFCGLLVESGVMSGKPPFTHDMIGSLSVDQTALTGHSALKIFLRCRVAVTSGKSDYGGLTFEGFVNALLAVALVAWPDPFLRVAAKVRRLMTVHIFPTFRRKLQLNFVGAASVQ